jgi:multiple sugar transport system ATP-binding protein
MAMALLNVAALAKSFRRNAVLDDISLQVNAGEIIVVFGPSGTGKTVLLRLIAGLEEPSSGSIAIEGRDMEGVPPEDRGIGMAFQNFALFPHMTAFENIASPLRASGANGAVAVGVEKVARLLKIDHVLGHAPRELSNGQKQRTSLARALAASPKLLLLDDPLRNVDAKLRFEMRLELPRLLRQSGSAVLYVTQDYKEAMALGDRIAVLQGGAFEQIASPEDIYNTPRSLAVARLFGDPAINIAESRIEASGNTASVALAGARIPLDAGYRAYAGGGVSVGIRPEAVVLAKAQGTPGALTAIVEAVTPLNERTVLLLKARNGWEFLASLPSWGTPIPEAGAQVEASFRPECLHLFDQETGRRIAVTAAQE